jgi:hypothetical protein
MSKSSLKNVHPVAIYRLQDLFEAVSADITSYAEQMTDMPEWAKNHPPAATHDALLVVQAQLAQWQNEGHTEVQASAPFADGRLTAPVEHMMTQQFKSGLVHPVIK